MYTIGVPRHMGLFKSCTVLVFLLGMYDLFIDNLNYNNGEIWAVIQRVMTDIIFFPTVFLTTSRVRT